MRYEFADEARVEADKHAPAELQLVALRDVVAAVAAGDGVRAHRIRFSPAAWGTAVVDRLPAAAAASGIISRGDVFDVAALVTSGTRPATDLFTASFVWGTGMTGYGPTRYRAIVEGAGQRLEPALQRALTAAREDPIAGYAVLYGGHDPKARAAPHQPPWGRIHRYGPAFFTKLLYFATPGALILDSVLAAAVHRLSGIAHLVTADHRSLPWSPYRYAVYLNWMNHTAQRLAVEPDVLECTLFRAPADGTGAPGSDHD